MGLKTGSESISLIARKTTMKGSKENNINNSSKLRDSMSPQKRAKQFMPFRAVTGLEAALRRKEEEVEEMDSVEHILEDPEEWEE